MTTTLPTIPIVLILVTHIIAVVGLASARATFIGPLTKIDWAIFFLNIGLSALFIVIAIHNTTAP